MKNETGPPSQENPRREVLESRFRRLVKEWSESFPGAHLPWDALRLPVLPIPFNINISTVTPEVYEETRWDVERAIPNVFIATIQPKTMEDLLTEDLAGEQAGQPRYFKHNWVNNSPVIRGTHPPEMEVFIDPENFKIPESNRRSRVLQKARIAEEAARVQEQLPENVRDLVVWQMMDPSTHAQLEQAHMVTHGGELLMPDFFFRVDVEPIWEATGTIGRFGPGDLLRVGSTAPDFGGSDLYAALVGVFPKKAAT